MRPGVDGMPSHYKIDLAFPDIMLAIEIDGGSHASITRKASDQRKDRFLVGLGWTVLRFTNKEVLRNLTSCVQTLMSTISKLKEHTSTSPTDSLSTTATT
jgi:very-short-patch-repair endonuclease